MADRGTGITAAPEAPEDDTTTRASDTGSESDLSDGLTLSTSIKQYRFENGRRYHAYRDGAYWGPNDERANDQEDLSHHIYLLSLDGKLFLAPIGDSPQKVLDVGTGTGIWAMDFADQFPSAEVIGTDLSPIQPLFVPPNLTFEVDDCCSPWIYPKDSFDFIHIRGLYGSVADYTQFYSEVVSHLKPGGWAEQVEKSVVPKSDDGSVTPDSIFAMWGQMSLDAGDKWGKTLKIVDESRRYMVDAGLEDVVEHRFKWPLGPWMAGRKWKEIGVYNRFHWQESVEGWALALMTRVMGWTYEETQAYLALMRQGLKDSKIHAYHEVYWTQLLYTDGNRSTI